MKRTHPQSVASGKWDGVTTTNEYYGGHGSGETGWAPIMGVGYYQPAAQWAKGEFNAANQPEDELSRIVSNNNDVAVSVDDTGNTLATARYLEVQPDGLVSAEGVIRRTKTRMRFNLLRRRIGFIDSPAGCRLGEPRHGGYDCRQRQHGATATIRKSTLWAGITTNLAAGTYVPGHRGREKQSAEHGFLRVRQLGILFHRRQCARRESADTIERLRARCQRHGRRHRSSNHGWQSRLLDRFREQRRHFCNRQHRVISVASSTFAIMRNAPQFDVFRRL